MSRVIDAFGAGTFFPADAATLRAQIARYLWSVTPPSCRPKAIIVPHAGYDYSGSVAGAAFACLASERGLIRQVVLLGTCHVVRTHDLLATTAEGFVTPLGRVDVDTEAVRRSGRLPQVSFDDEAHSLDHSLAVQLPLLQTALDEFRVVPLLVGECAAPQVRELLDLLWGSGETLIVVSSDLSHHLSYDDARRRDAQTALVIEHLDADAVGRDQACGHRAIGGLLLAARRHRLRVRQIDVRNSGDTSGRRDRVVGYGAFVFEAEDGHVA